MFCPKCGSLLISKNGKLVCPEHGPVEKEVTFKEKSKTKKDVGVMKEKPEVHPKTKAQCPKCGNNEAYYWVVQTRAADEPPTRFYKCTKCGHVWREYS